MGTKQDCKRGDHTVDNQGLCHWCGTMIEQDWYDSYIGKVESTMAMIDITGLDKAEVLAALFNASKQQGIGFLDTTGATPMTADDARKVIGHNPGEWDYCFDYLKGRVMKVDISGDEFDPILYDRNNGMCSAARAIHPLREVKAE